MLSGEAKPSAATRGFSVGTLAKTINLSPRRFNLAPLNPHGYLAVVKILLTNDDGVRADGLAVLASRLSELGSVHVVAPDRERSCTGHAFTLNEPLRVERVAPHWYSVSGTPADCVYLGVLELCPRPDLVISGINHGYNLGADIFYSGTVAGAVEAALRGVPAIAVSMGYAPGADFLPAAKLCCAVVQAAVRSGLPKTVLNINVPGQKHAKPEAPSNSFMWTRLGQQSYREHVDSRTDPRGNTYYWIGGPAEACNDPPGTDSYAIHQGISSVTPLNLDLTHSEVLAQLPSWQLSGWTAVGGL
jgi:5'-nucleotidase